ncbi:amino acid ABC transporter substrate-binding protein [Ottowia caeni]|uniref:amino acid ABC transporter substrate-binding protein n=1 Tax=Ottowia caeni TaxID=2870339 RepID=UPI001E4C425E|nr:amino acid ABC transporter substrate-binding protein [Ottowia caeni]
MAFSSRTLGKHLLAASLLAAASLPAFAGKTLDTIKSRDQLVVGVSTGVPGLSAPDSQGRWAGLDVDIGRAVAAAILGDGEKTKWVPLNVQQRFTAIQSGEVDLLSRGTTFTLTRDASLGLNQTAIVLFDGQGFMVPAKSKVTSAKQLKGATVCLQGSNTTEKNLADFSRANKLNLKPVVFENLDASAGAYFSGRCDAYTSDVSGLAAIRSKEAKNPKDHVILPELISKEPLGPLVRRGDDEFFAIVKWVVYGLIEAEENGITQANVDQLKASSTDPVVQRLLGKGDDMGKLLGLDREWLARAIKTVGNYGEIFERNLGEKTPVGLPRGLNRLWNQGGLLYAPPVR